MPEYACFCGEAFEGRELLVDHNVDVHDMSTDDARRAVDEKYPMAA